MPIRTLRSYIIPYALFETKTNKYQTGFKQTKPKMNLNNTLFYDYI